MGYKFQFVTLAGFHSLNHGMFELSQAYSKRGMAAYSELQQVCPISEVLSVRECPCREYLLHAHAVLWLWAWCSYLVPWRSHCSGGQ